MRRQILVSLFFVSLVTFGVIISVTMIKFSLPVQEGLVDIGSTYNFDSANTPYLLREPEGYLVLLEGEYIFLSNRPPHPPFANTCKIAWNVGRNQFMEPCGGSYFSIDGTLKGGPSPRSMDSYPVSVLEDSVWVDMSTLIEGAARR